MQVYAAQKTALVVSTTGVKATALDDFIEYRLLPELIKMTGSAHIDFLVIIQPAITAFQLAENLCKKKLVSRVYISTGKKQLNAKTYQAYQALRAIAELYQIELHLFEFDCPLSLDLGRQARLEIQQSTVVLKSSS